MTEEQILKAFEGRWRIKGNFGQINSNTATMSFDEFYDYIKGMCLDFFQTGIMLAERNTMPAYANTMKMEMPITPEEADAPPSCLVRESDILTVEDTFNKWWDMYGKKIDRTKCFNKWKKLTAKEQFDCIKATPAYVASTPDLQFRRHPMTYLNNKSWENQIIPRNGTDKPTIEQQRIDKLADILTK